MSITDTGIKRHSTHPGEMLREAAQEMKILMNVPFCASTFRLPYICVAAVAMLCALPISTAIGHDIPEHGLRVELPPGWERIEALSGNTILKLARTDASGNQARIVLATYLMGQRVDVSRISRDSHIRSLKAGSLLGEEVSVIDVGRTQIDNIDALWGKTHRDLPSQGSTYEYTYELSREHEGISNGFTIRLTSYGDERWFQANAIAFDRFIRSIQFNPRPIAQTQIQQESPPLRLQIIKEGDPLWFALVKGFGEVFIMILLATVVIGVAKWLYSKHVASKKLEGDRTPPDAE